MAAKFYSTIRILIDGQYMAELTSGSIDFDPRLNEVETVDGFGYTPGSKRVTITIGEAVPIGGLEFDFARALALSTSHQVEFVFGGQSYVSNGLFTGGSINGGANANTEASFTWVGDLDDTKIV